MRERVGQRMCMHMCVCMCTHWPEHVHTIVLTTSQVMSQNCCVFLEFIFCSPQEIFCNPHYQDVMVAGRVYLSDPTVGIKLCWWCK